MIIAPGLVNYGFGMGDTPPYHVLSPVRSAISPLGGMAFFLRGPTPYTSKFYIAIISTMISFFPASMVKHVLNIPLGISSIKSHKLSPGKLCILGPNFFWGTYPVSTIAIL